MTLEQWMAKPVTISKLMVIGLLGAFALLLVEIRFEHREALGEAWQSWIPLVYSEMSCTNKSKERAAVYCRETALWSS